MVIISDLLIMIGLPVALFVLHRLFPEAVERRKNLILSILSIWFLYTFFGSRLIHGGATQFVLFSALVVAALGALMFLVIKNYPDQVRCSAHPRASAAGLCADARRSSHPVHRIRRSPPR